MQVLQLLVSCKGLEEGGSAELQPSQREPIWAESRAGQGLMDYDTVHTRAQCQAEPGRARPRGDCLTWDRDHQLLREVRQLVVYSQLISVPSSPDEELTFPKGLTGCAEHTKEETTVKIRLSVQRQSNK
ncbi:hypothetical protein EYF80_018029 [Liparis tanakae]|uniref:Uncharacterized protein n=1 Tax=Liparis tanakae TaxID=230148 RepID=A0A4Z2I191_9TELE|nr:hypothetical protein EYF80_018029 [Liparis tanakae]